VTDLQAIYSLISPDIKPNPEEDGTYGIPCSNISSIPAEISFIFKSSTNTEFNLTIPSPELNVGPFQSNPSLCQTLINAQEFGVGILGGSLLKYYYSIWDIQNQQLGFAPLCKFFFFTLISAAHVSSLTAINGTNGTIPSTVFTPNGAASTSAATHSLLFVLSAFAICALLM
jgi:hypothetical protein